MRNKRKRLGALDICILVAVLLCIVGIAARMVFRDNSVLAQNTPLDEYTVYFTISNIRSTSDKFLKDGKEFYIEETGEYFGKITGNPTVTYARKLYVDMYGNTVEVSNNTDEEGISRIDVEGAFLVSAMMDENGFLMLNGNHPVAPNQEIQIRSRELYVNMRINSIEKVN
ncbi:MAG: hypothetical protein IJX14_03345 [Clostridia bacterium]|nr:hypothetical protein [Clostridia bacterium]